MATETTFYKTITYLIKNFKDALMSGTNSTYFFIGGGLPYPNNDTEIITVNDCTSCENSIWDSMVAAKKIYPNEVELVVPRKTWVFGRIYKDFDDTDIIEYLNTDDIANNLYAMYTINSENNVYKCLFNNHSVVSTDEPTGDYTISDGFIETLDGYVWKYMYNVKDTNKFLTVDWMPVPYTANVHTSDIEYNISPSYILEGTINKIEIEFPGSSYIDSEIITGPFEAGATYLQVPSIDNLEVNMEVSGTGITPGTYITSTSFEYNRVYLSIPTLSAGGGSTHPVQVSTRVVIDGDGIGAQATLTLSGTSIDTIDVLLMGSGYTYANILIYGTGSGAVARAIIPPKYGHGIMPATELSSKSIIITKTFGEIDATEEGIIPVDIKFRQYGLLINPRNYGSLDIVDSDSSSIASQTMDVTLESGSLYSEGEYIYQGSLEAPSFYGYVLSQDYYTVKVVNFYGTPIIGTLLTNGLISRPVTTFTTPTFEKYSGDILYVKNISPVGRVLNQSEEIRIIIEI